ncbi:MAG TPA: hypothetical protein VEM57_08695 [Candidatus Binatus sp.]|nr:hypothetical protein [Candidatus Binatus sp.]
MVDGTFAVAPRAVLAAGGQAVAGDTIGPDGGTISVTAHDVNIGGDVGVTAEGTNAIVAGDGGTITVTADGSVAIADTARLDASTSRGGCGGSIVVTGPASLDSAGLLYVEGATRGGTIRLTARDVLSVAGTLQASNTNSDQRSRPACRNGKGGGEIRLEASRVLFTGFTRARGREAAGGAVFFRGEREVTVDSAAGRVPIVVSGGDADRFTPGGVVSLVATAGDVTVRQGAIEADGLSTGAGSDAGAFFITASGTTRCASSGALCDDQTACAPGEPCVEAGGRVDVQAALSAVGGDGLGSGCVACEIRGTGDVTVSGPVNVGGARQRGVGGKVTLAGGGNLTVGPGPVTASAGDGGSILLVAGERMGSVRGIQGGLRIVNGTELLADARLDDGFGGDIGVEGCDLTVEPGVRLTVDGGQHGRPGAIDLVAHERLDVGALAGFSAWPDGAITVSYGVEATIAPDAVFVPAPLLAQDATLPPCPACGNGVTEGLEECDGRGTCGVAGEICIPAGSAGECGCIDTCGAVGGVQSGEECDAADLDGQSCASRGFSGGVLACAEDCTFDAGACFTDVCGDGVAGPTEDCDPGGTGVPPSFGGKTCETLGFPGGGDLVCNQDCTVDPGACVDHRCGNGIVESTEECDPPGFGGKTCESVGFPAGGSLACTPDCTALVTVPHCSTTVSRPCTASADCPGAEACVPGCRQCGNGFVDAPGEQCDDGPDNGSLPDHCRVDCQLPRCGDETVDRGEECDRGQARCRGGTNDGGGCCRASDCPGGECAGDTCTANRDDVAGCCGCDCTLAPVACGSCDDLNPCTADVCDPRSGCTHAALADGTPCSDRDACNGEETCRSGRCTAGSAPGCDDGDLCTIDTCDRISGCRHAALGYADAAGTVEASLFIATCAGEKVPGRIGRLLGQARILIERAGGTSRGRAARLVARAAKKLRLARRAARRAEQHGLAPRCAGPLEEIIGVALARARCFPGGELS